MNPPPCSSNIVYSKTRKNKQAYSSCEVCGKVRLVRVDKNGDPLHTQCYSCSNRKQGKVIDGHGYVLILVYPNDFFFPMVINKRNRKNGQGRYIREHRLVMAKHLGRCLHPWEIVHHINGDKSDNRIENLQLVSDGNHKQITVLEKELAKALWEIKLLKEENNRLTGIVQMEDYKRN